MTRTRFDHRKVVRSAVIGLGGLLLAFATGCKWANLSGPQSTMLTEGPVARAQWDLFMVTVYVTTFIFIVVGAVLAYAQIKFRAKSSADEKAEPPPQGHGNPFIELGLIVASIALLVIIAIPTLKGIWYTHDVPEEEKANAMDVTAVGYQWWFKFEYNSETAKNADGTDGANLVTANELVVPAGVPIRVHLRTVDVIHSFWIPKLAGKVDMIPNRGNQIWFKAEKPGYYYGQCAEYCGESHAIMRFRVIALSPSDYVKWLDNQKHGARTADAKAIAAAAEQPRLQFASLTNVGPNSTLAGSPQFDADPFAAWKAKQHAPAGENAALIAQGHDLFAEKSCMNCHSIRGHASKGGAPYGGLTAPDLTHVGARSSIAAGVLENTPERMAQWLKDPEYFKPGNKMVHGIGGMAGYFRYENGQAIRNITLSDHEIEALVAYLQSLK
jgi:cytochrome c oxidase subunit 2